MVTMLPQGYPEVTFYRNLQTLMRQGFAADFQKSYQCYRFPEGYFILATITKRQRLIAIPTIFNRMPAPTGQAGFKSPNLGKSARSLHATGEAQKVPLMLLILGL